jgi:hypothetical protein
VPHRTRTWRRAAALALACALPAGAATASARPAPAVRPVVGIVGDSGLNPLHDEFRTRDGRDPAYPPGMPHPVRVAMPRSGTFEERLDALRAGPLGHPKAGTLYALSGTRLLVYATPGQPDPLTDRAHGTGTASAAIGNRTGSAPDALAVFVVGNAPAAHEWLAAQRWIDVASISAYTIATDDPCHNAHAGRLLPQDGGLLFSSAGNLVDYAEPFEFPNGLAETYQVGGVDSTGRTWIPPRPEATNPFLVTGNVVRPYESGARYDFLAPGPDSLTGTMEFGGTSGATPTVAGYAVLLVAEARRLLGAHGGRTRTALATRGPGVRPPSRGPLADGVFTRDELVDLLHVTAIPKETGPERYLLEGFGATNAASHAKALAVLRGTATAPERPDEQALHDQVEAARAAQASRCT